MAHYDASKHFSAYLDGCNDEFWRTICLRLFNESYELREKWSFERYVNWKIHLEEVMPEIRDAIFNSTRVHANILLCLNRGWYGVIKIMLSNTAMIESCTAEDLNACDNRGCSPLIEACCFSPQRALTKYMMNNISMRKLEWQLSLCKKNTHALIKAGANIYYTTDDGISVLLGVCFNIPSALSLLIERGMDMSKAVNDKKGNYTTALHLLAHCPFANLSHFRLLIENGCSVNARNSEESTPLHEIAKFVSKHFNPQITSYNEHNETLWKLRPDEKQIIDLLIKSGADRNARDASGRTPARLCSAANFGKRLLPDDNPLHRAHW